MLEHDVYVTLYVSPIVLKHHKRVFTAGKYLVHGLAVGICYLRH